MSPIIFVPRVISADLPQKVDSVFPTNGSVPVLRPETAQPRKCVRMVFVALAIASMDVFAVARLCVQQNFAALPQTRRISVCNCVGTVQDLPPALLEDHATMTNYVNGERSAFWQTASVSA